MLSQPAQRATAAHAGPTGLEVLRGLPGDTGRAGSICATRTTERALRPKARHDDRARQAGRYICFGIVPNGHTAPAASCVTTSCGRCLTTTGDACAGLPD